MTPGDRRFVVTTSRDTVVVRLGERWGVHKGMLCTGREEVEAKAAAVGCVADHSCTSGRANFSESCTRLHFHLCSLRMSMVLLQALMCVDGLDSYPLSCIVYVDSKKSLY